jgi:hypothetical protein
MESRAQVFRDVAERFAVGAVPKNEPRVKASPRAPLFADRAAGCYYWCPVLPCRESASDKRSKA